MLEESYQTDLAGAHPFKMFLEHLSWARDSSMSLPMSVSSFQQLLREE